MHDPQVGNFLKYVKIRWFRDVKYRILSDRWFSIYYHDRCYQELQPLITLHGNVLISLFSHNSNDRLCIDLVFSQYVTNASIASITYHKNYRITH